MSNKQRRSIEETLLSVEFLNSLRAGEHIAFATLYIHFQQPLKSFIYSLLRSDSEADDITQEVFMKIWEGREMIDVNKNIKSFIFTIAKNTVMNRFNHQKIIDRYSQNSRLTGDNFKTPEDLLIAQETELIIELAVSRMPDMRRAVYEMSVNQLLSHEEIAEKLNTTKQNVANHLSHAKKELHEILAIFTIMLMIWL